MEHHGARSLVSSEQGGVAVIWAICMTVLMMIITLLIDGAAVVAAKRAMQQALDIAAVSGATLLLDDSLDDDGINVSVEATFAQNIASARGDLTCTQTASVFDRDTGDISVTAICWYKPMLGGTIAPKQVKVTAKTKAFISRQKLDVAMVLDLSGSMNANGKLAALKSASKIAASNLLGSGHSGDVRVSYVAYSGAVNVNLYGPYATGDSSTVLPPGPVAWSQYCVSERIVDGAWDDRPPGPGAYFTFGGMNCPDSGLFTLSADLSKFANAIDGLTASGNTAGHVGAAWAWNLLSPKWADIWPTSSKPLAYDAENALKVVILMTDGKFNNASRGATLTSSEQAVKLCEAMRDEDILIFSVAFQAPLAGQQTLKSCAGDESFYYEASSNAELIAIYEEIASRLVVLRITE